MNKFSDDSMLIKEAIDEQEKELKQLLARVMKEPLDPVVERIDSLSQRLEMVEKQCQETQDDHIPALGRVLKAQADETRKRLESLRDDLGEDIEELLSSTLAQLSQDFALLREEQGQSREALAQLSEEQAMRGRAAEAALERQRMQFEQSGVRLVDELRQGMDKSEVLAKDLGLLRQEQERSHESMILLHSEHAARGQAQSEALKQCDIALKNVLVHLDAVGLQAKAAVDGSAKILSTLDTGFKSNGAMLERQSTQLEQSSARLADELHQSTDRVDSLAPQVSQKVEGLGVVLQQRLQQMQQRVFWLTVVSGISLAGTVALLVKVLM